MNGHRDRRAFGASTYLRCQTDLGSSSTYCPIRLTTTTLSTHTQSQAVTLNLSTAIDIMSNSDYYMDSSNYGYTPSLGWSVAFITLFGLSASESDWTVPGHRFSSVFFSLTLLFSHVVLSTSWLLSTATSPASPHLFRVCHPPPSPAFHLGHMSLEPLPRESI